MLRIRFLTPILLLTALAGCYTQLRAPSPSAEKTVFPDSTRAEPARGFSWFRPSYYTPFSTYYYDPFSPWAMAYSVRIFSSDDFVLPLPTHSPAPDSIGVRLPRFRLIGFDSAIPSAAAIRGTGKTTVTVGYQRNERSLDVDRQKPQESQSVTAWKEQPQKWRPRESSKGSGSSDRPGSQVKSRPKKESTPAKKQASREEKRKERRKRPR